MNQAIVQHAQKVIWQEPAQDYQYNIGLARLTPKGGVIHSQNVLWHQVLVPERGSRKWYHIYQVGQIPPKLFGLALNKNNWIRLDTLCEMHSMLIDLYLETGALIPRNKAYLMMDFSKDVLVAIEIDKKLDFGTDMRIDDYLGTVKDEKITLDHSKVIIRFYANAHFSNISFRDLAVNPNTPIKMHYQLVNNQADFDAFTAQCDKIVKSFNYHGRGIYYIDGFVCNKPNGFNDKYKGHVLGFMWDESFKLDKFFNLSHVPAFQSKIDRGQQKYLLLTDEEYDIIDYHDDIDFFVVGSTPTGWKGVYISRVKKSAVRQVTHSAYSVDADLIQYYLSVHDFLGTADDCFIYMMVRQGGKLSGLYNQKNRIEELYRIRATDTIEDAMINTLSLVPEWRAAELEASAYVQLMGAEPSQLVPKLVQDAYGYSALTQYMCPPIHTLRRRGNIYQVIVPPAMQIPDNVDGHGRRAVFCYDPNGELISYFNDSSTDTLVTIPQDIAGTKTVEIFNGVIDDDAGIWVNRDVTSNEIEQYGFRCYVSPMHALEPTEKWEDVTHQSNWYEFIPGTPKTDAQIKWNWRLLQEAGLMPAVKTNARIGIFTYVHDDKDRDGCVDFIVKTRQWWGKAKRYRNQTVPPAQVTVFANGKTLIEDIDYYMQWPKIVIVNKDINAARSVEIIVRSYGCGKPIEDGPARPYKPREVGFVKNGRLSIDGEYDIHNDKNIKITVAGALKRRDEVSLSEDEVDDQIAALQPDGRPYAIEDYILPIENFTVDERTNEFYEQVVEIEDRVTAYISNYVPEKDYGVAKVEKLRWQVVSPVLTALIYAFKHGYAIDANTSENFDTIEVDHWLTPYKWLLEYDPAYKMVDTNYIHIAPHPYPGTIEVTQKQYELLEMVIKLKLNDLVDLSRYLTIDIED